MSERKQRRRLRCKWRWDHRHGKWDSECKNAFYVLDDATFWPREAGFQFCPFCGGRIEPTKSAETEPAE